MTIAKPSVRYLRREPREDEVLLATWVIFERPRDYPNGFVVRRQVAARCGGIWVDPIAVGVATLEQARAEVPVGSTNMGRFDGDDPAIKETWI